MPHLALSRTNFPFISRAGSIAPLEWNHGPLYKALISSSILRVSDRGVSWCATCDMQQSPQIEALACLPVDNALCAVKTGLGNSTIRLFPTTEVNVPADVRILSAPEDATALGRLWAAAIDGCEGVHSRRSLVFQMHEYDISLCDLVHGQIDFVLYPQDGKLVWSKRDEANLFHSILWTAFIIVAVLFLFTRVCDNLFHIIHGRRRNFDMYSTAATIVGALCSVPAAAHNDFATEEHILAILLQAYALLYSGILVGQHCRAAYAQYHSLPASEREEQPSESSTSVNTTGAIIAVLLLLTAHLSNTFDSPFLNMFVLIFGARSFLKFLNLVLIHSTKSLPRACSKLAGLCMDTFAFACLLELGVRSSARSHDEFASTAAGLVLLSVLAGVLLFCLVERNAKNTNPSI